MASPTPSINVHLAHTLSVSVFPPLSVVITVSTFPSHDPVMLDQDRLMHKETKGPHKWLNPPWNKYSMMMKMAL